MTPEDRRRRTDRAGRAGEVLAELYLRLKGYRILARRFRHPLGEVDLLALAPRSSDFPTLVAVEVKRRLRLDDAALALRSRQQHRIAQAARGFLAARRGFERATLRFDLVLIAPGRWPRHLVSAWQEE